MKTQDHAEWNEAKGHLIDGFSRAYRKETERLIKGHVPKLYKGLYQGPVQVPHNYEPYKTFALRASLLTWGFITSPHHDKIINFVIENINEHLRGPRIPIYCVTKELIEALDNTELPADLTLEDFKWPLNNFVFALEKGSLVHPVDSPGEIDFISVANIQKYDTAPIKKLLPPKYQKIFPDYKGVDPVWKQLGVLMPQMSDGLDEIPDDEDGCSKLGIWAHGSKTCDYVKCIPLTGHLSSRFECGFSVTTLVSGEEVASSLEDRQFNHKMMGLALKIVLYMVFKESKYFEAVTNTISTGKKRTRKLKAYRPPIVGSGFKMKSQDQEGDSPQARSREIKPSIHAGHFKSQPYGPKSSLRKRIWVEPYLWGFGDRKSE